MKALFNSLLTLALLLSGVATSAQAAAVSAVPVRVVYDCCAAKPAVWTAIVTSTSKAIKGISIFNSGTVGFQVALGAAGSEVAQLVVPAGNAAPGSTLPVYYPFVASQSQRISIKPLGSTGSSGEADFNLFYN